jgi:hypothetical protein
MLSDRSKERLGAEAIARLFRGPTTVRQGTPQIVLKRSLNGRELRNIRRLHRLRRCLVSVSLRIAVGPNKATCAHSISPSLIKCFPLDNNLFVANKIGSIMGLQSSAFIKQWHWSLWAKWDSTIPTGLQTSVRPYLKKSA